MVALARVCVSCSISAFSALFASKKAKPVTNVTGNNPTSRNAPSKMNRKGKAFRNIWFNARMNTYLEE
jgi:hypothetical protein